MIGSASILQVKEWMGQADVVTTKYLPRSTDGAAGGRGIRARIACGFAR
jgi:hypothetical protein